MYNGGLKMYIPIFIRKDDGSKPTEEEIKRLASLMEQYEPNGIHPIKERRKKAGKTIREAARYVGIKIGQLSAYEHNREEIPVDVLRELETFYGEGE